MYFKHTKIHLTLVCAFAFVMMCLSLGACQKDTGDVTSPAVSDDDPAVSGSALSFSYDGTPIVPGELYSEIAADLGEPDESFDMPSPIFETDDTIYYYSGFAINTYLDEDGAQRILSISLDDDSITTDKGAYLGMSKDEAEALYGNGIENMELPIVTYREGDIKLRLAFDESDYVIDITLSYAPVQDLYDEIEDQALADYQNDEDSEDDVDSQAGGADADADADADGADVSTDDTISNTDEQNAG